MIKETCVRAASDSSLPARTERSKGGDDGNCCAIVSCARHNLRMGRFPIKKGRDLQ